MDNRVNRRRRRNLPAELKVEIVDCLPLENAVHFLANVPSRLIIHHCAPRVRRMLKMIGQILIGYSRKLPAPDSHGDTILKNVHHYTPEMDIFLRYGAAHCDHFYIYRCASGFIGYPVDFFDGLIKYYYETKLPTKAVRELIIELPLNNPPPWPAALVQPRAGEMDLVEWKVHKDGEWVRYILRNKNNPNIAFLLWILSEGDAKCYQEMTAFLISRVE